LDTCEKRTTAKCQIPIFSAGETRFFPEVAIAPQWLYFLQVHFHICHSCSHVHVPVHVCVAAAAAASTFIATPATTITATATYHFAACYVDAWVKM